MAPDDPWAVVGTSAAAHAGDDPWAVVSSSEPKHEAIAPMEGTAPPQRPDAPAPGVLERYGEAAAEPWKGWTDAPPESAVETEKATRGTPFHVPATLAVDVGARALNSLGAAFGTVTNVAAQSVEDIAKIGGVSPETAARIKRDIAGSPEAFMGSPGAMGAPKMIPEEFARRAMAETPPPRVEPTFDSPAKAALNRMASGAPPGASSATVADPKGTLDTIATTGKPPAPTPPPAAAAPDVAGPAPHPTQPGMWDVADEKPAGAAQQAPAPAPQITGTTREPPADVHAQVRAMLDPKSTKDAVFVSSPNVADLPKDIPAHVQRIDTPAGTLLTTDAAKADAFRRAPTDDTLASVLGYPQTKSEVLGRWASGETGQPVIVQAHDAGGNIVSQALTSPDRVDETRQALTGHAGPGGLTSLTDPTSAQARRSAAAAPQPRGEPGATVNRRGEPMPKLLETPEATPAEMAQRQRATRAYDMTDEELESGITEKDTSDHDKLVQALGSEDAAAEFNRLDRKQNSSNPQRADEGAREFDAKFWNLTPEQERLIYGIGETGPQAEDMRAVREARAILPSDSLSEVARTLTRGMLDTDPETVAAVRNGSEMGLAAQVATTRIDSALAELKRRDASTEDINRAVAGVMSARGYSPDDAQEMLGRFRGTRKPQEPAENMPLMGGEQQGRLPDPYRPGVMQRDKNGRPLLREQIKPGATDRLEKAIRERANDPDASSSGEVVREPTAGRGPTRLSRPSGAGGQPPRGGAGAPPGAPPPPRGPRGPQGQMPLQGGAMIQRKNGIIARSFIGKIFSPSTVSPMAEAQAGLIRRMLGEARRVTQQARAGLEQFRNDAPLIGTPEGDDLMAYMEGRSTGATLGNPAHQPLADEVRRLNKNREAAIRALPAQAQRAFIDDYVSHQWKDPAAARQAFSTTGAGGYAKWQGSGRNLKQRVIPTYADGIAMGLEPLHSNIIDGEMAYLANIDRFIATNRILDTMRGTGMAQHYLPGAAPAGMKPLNGILAERAIPIGQGAAPMKLYAPEDVARVYNNSIGRGIMDTAAGPLYDRLLRAKNGMTGFELFFPMFHAVTESTEAVFSQMARGIMTGASGDPIKGLKQFAAAPLAPYRSMQLGRSAVAEYLQPGSQAANIARSVDLMSKANFSPLGRGEQQYFIAKRGAYASLKDAGDALREAGADIKASPIVGPFRQFAQQTGRIMDTVNKPLFDYAIPRVKAGAFLGRMQDWIEQHPTSSYEEQLAAARDIGDSIDNRFGELNYDNAMWHPIMKQTAFLSMRAFGWAIGTWREIGGGVADMARGKFTDRAAYVVGLGVGTAMINGMISYLKTGQAPTFQDLYAYDTGKKNEHGDEIHSMIPGYAREFATLGANVATKGVSAIGSYAYGKTASMWTTALELLENRDFKGDPIAPPGQGITKEGIKRYATEALSHYTPMNLREAMGIDDTNTTKGLSLIEKGLAIRNAPFAVNSPDAARKFFTKEEEKPEGPSDRWKMKLRREAADAAAKRRQAQPQP